MAREEICHVGERSPEKEGHEESEAPSTDKFG